MKKFFLLFLMGALISYESTAIGQATIAPTSPEALQGILGSAFKAEAGKANRKHNVQPLENLTPSVKVGDDNKTPPADAARTTLPKQPATVVMQGHAVDDASWLLPQMKKNAMASERSIAHKPYQSLPLKTVYRSMGKNTISDTDGNAILSPVPIAHIAAAPGSIIIDQWIDNANGAHIGVVFNVKGSHRHVVQLMLMTQGSHPAVSLVFHVAHVHGRVFRLPQQLVGIAPLSTSPIFGEPSAYDSQVIRMMQPVLTHQSLGNTWDYTVRYHPPSPYQEFRVKRHQRWLNQRYRIDAFDLCSRYHGILYLRANTFATYHTIAVTLTQNRLALGQCTRLVVLSMATRAAHRREAPSHVLGPAKEQSHD